MSVMLLSTTMVASMRHKFLYMINNDVSGSDYPTQTLKYFKGPDGLDTTAGLERFCEQCVRFNYESVNYRYKGDAPVIYSKDIYEMCKKTAGTSLTAAALLKTLMCFEYNSDCDSYMDDEVYQSWPERVEFEEYRKTINNLISEVTKHIAIHTEEFKKAKWCY